MQQNERIWRAVLGEIEIAVSSGNFSTWFKHTRLLATSDDAVLISVGSIFIKNQLERKYPDLIMSALAKHGLTPSRIEFKIQPSTRPTPETEDVDKLLSNEPVRTAKASVSSPLSVRPVTRPSTSPSEFTARPRLNDRYVFDNFIVGAGNELAFAACQSIASNPGTRYNPLFLYGGVGIGKTHLIQAVGNAVLAKDPDAKVIYINTEQFVKEFVDSLRTQKTAEFANRYRSADVLIVDDIQFIAGKEKIQEEFFHTFNSLHQSNKQIIISSDKPPKEIPTLEERLRSRFAWGVSIDMQTPDFETRCAIIQTKAMAHNIELSVDVVEHLATNNQNNIRELEGALNQLLAWCEMRNLEPTIAIATSLFGNNKGRPKHLSARQIIERTARHFQIPVEDILSPKRDKDIVVPRQVAMYMMRSELHLSFPKIAHELGRKDHTTAMHSIEKIQQEINANADIRTAVNEIKEHLYV